MVSTLVHNEQIKLAATYLNNIAVAAFTLGCTAPLFTQTVNLTQSSVLGTILAFIAHTGARFTLHWLKE